MVSLLSNLLIPILFALPSVIKKFFLPPLKKRITRWISNKIVIKKAEVLRVYVNFNQTGLNCVEFRKEFDNRSPDRLEAEMIFLRVYINKAPCRIIEWEKEEEDYCRIQAIREIGIVGYEYPTFELPRDKKTEMSIYVFLPPHVSTSEDVDIDLFGYINLKYSFGFLKKTISDTKITIRKGDWQ